MFASLGSMLDIDFGDLIDYLGDDPKTKSIMIYHGRRGACKEIYERREGLCPDQADNRAEAGEVQGGDRRRHLPHRGHDRRRPCVRRGLQAGGRRQGRQHKRPLSIARPSSTHTTSPPGQRLAVITNAGAPGVITADWLIAQGGTLATLSAETTSRLDSVLPRSWSRGNPVNVLGDADTERYTDALTICLDDPGVDGVLLIYTPQWPAIPRPSRRRCRRSPIGRRSRSSRHSWGQRPSRPAGTSSSTTASLRTTHRRRP